MDADTTKTRERPILFSGPMVNAILDGTKTMTRRVVKPQPAKVDVPEEGFVSCDPIGGVYGRQRFVCGPDGENDVEAIDFPVKSRIVPGIRLWVSERLAMIDGGTWTYEADGAPVEADARDHERVLLMTSWAYHKDGETCPSIHMPRWASRITLEVVSVRVERVQAITEADAKAEGSEPSKGLDFTARHAFSALWDSINGKREGASWEANPWVWVVEFKRVEAPDARP